MPNDYTSESLTERLKSPGWQRTGGGTYETGTLEDMARSAHADRAKNPGIIQNIENAVELELVQLQQLWHYLGLPD